MPPFGAQHQRYLQQDTGAPSAAPPLQRPGLTCPQADTVRLGTGGREPCATRSWASGSWEGLLSPQCRRRARPRGPRRPSALPGQQRPPARGTAALQQGPPVSVLREFHPGAMKVDNISGCLCSCSPQTLSFMLTLQFW